MDYPVGTWLAIKFGNSEYPNLVCIKNSRKDFYWGQGFGWCVWTDDVEILKNYGIQKGNEDDIEISFFNEFIGIPKPTIEKSAGWISPDGKFYSCGTTEHRGLAKRLCVHFYGDLDNPEKTLEENFWLKVLDDGTIFDVRVSIKPLLKNFELTEKQEKTLLNLAICNNDLEWKHNIHNYLDFCDFN